MKKPIILFFSVVLAFSFAACNRSSSEEAGYSEPAKTDTTITGEAGDACLMPIYFDTEEELIEMIVAAKNPKEGEGSVIVSSKFAGDQAYNLISDWSGLADIDELYHPADAGGESLLYVKVSKDCIAYYYGADQDTRNFVLMRSMTPDIAYNELEDRGFSVRMIEKNGVVYAVMEGHDPEAPDKNPTCIQWAEDGKVFHANFRDMKDDDAALAFCNYVTIPVK